MIGTVELSDAQRGAIGARLGRISELVEEARRAGLSSPTAAELQEAVERMKELTAAVAPAPPRNLIPALLSSAWVAAHELRPKSLRGYGKLSGRAAALLEQEAQLLIELISNLLEEAESGGQMRCRSKRSS